MEALGRMLAVFTAVVGLVCFLVFYKTASVRWQKTESVRSITQAYAEDILQRKEVSRAGWEQFCKELQQFGEYRTELTVYERRRFEGENGRVYLFTEWRGNETTKALSKGSYIRIVVTEGRKAAEFFYGTGSSVIAGGRIA